jgi:hypothetical protein
MILAKQVLNDQRGVPNRTNESRYASGKAFGHNWPQERYHGAKRVGGPFSKSEHDIGRADELSTFDLLRYASRRHNANIASTAPLLMEDNRSCYRQNRFKIDEDAWEWGLEGRRRSVRRVWGREHMTQRYNKGDGYTRKKRRSIDGGGTTYNFMVDAS